MTNSVAACEFESWVRTVERTEGIVEIAFGDFKIG
jgi:hypothetical protein